MEDLLKILVGALGSIIVAGAAFVVSWFKSMQKKLDDLESRNKNKEATIDRLHNGFRDEVKNELVALNKKFAKVETLETDVKILKKAILEGK